MDNITELEKRISELKNNGSNKSSNSIWNVLDNRTKELTEQDIIAINSSEDVRKVKEEMLSSFVGMFLFSKYRDEFASIPSFRPICDKYISSVLSVKSDIYKKNLSLEEENKKLKQELQQLKGAIK